MNKLNKIVNEMIEKHEGGTEFFDNLDENIRNNENIIDELIKMAEGWSMEVTVVSGSFGRLFSNYYSGDKKVITVNGGLRTGNHIDDLSYTDIDDKTAIFIDDSFYSGKTRDIIKSELHKNNCDLCVSIVAYDGSRFEEVDVYSLYRYYDKFTL